jgi:hypothetical protein
MSEIHVKTAEGFLKRDNEVQNRYNTVRGNQLNLPPVFQRWVVLETVFDPNIITLDKIKELEGLHGEIRNREFAIDKTLPRNSILARPVYKSADGDITYAKTNLFLYPLFPSALSMPCKPGEHVWVMFESLTQRQILGYWVCSIVGSGHVDDVNHSHHPREYDETFLISKEENVEARFKHQEKIKKPRYHFKNGVYKKIFLDDDSTIVDPDSALISGDEGEYEKIIQQSDAAKASVYEAVPRFKKRPGDIALEGSNNTLIVLGRDRLGRVASYNPNDIFENSFSVDRTNPNLSKKNAGSIDIVAGRGQRPETGGKKVINHLQNQELAKDKVSTTQFSNEGDPDFLNDRSRIYVSQNTRVDESLLLTQKNSSRTPKVLDSENGDAGIIIKSDKVRIFARSDVQILVTGFSEEPIESAVGDYEPDTISNDNSANNTTQQIGENSIKTQNSDSKKWASITIKSNGDIVFEPSDTGYIKLGGEDANRGIVCTAQPVIAVNGGIAGTSIMTNGGGLIAGSQNPSPSGNIPALPQQGNADLGTFANKVLIK